MHPFAVERPRDLDAALALRAQAGRNDTPTEYIAGGTDMVQLLQEHVRRPERLVSLAGLLDNRIELGPLGLRIGAAATMADVAAHPAVVEQFPVISEALLNSASPQVRNQATMGGNLLQRTRCPYFRDVGYAACNKRGPGSGCSAIGGENRWHAVLGTSDNCIAANPSDLAVALVALDAALEVRSAGGQRSLSLIDFHRLPGDTPHIETVLEAGEVIAAITVPANPAARRSHYLRARRGAGTITSRSNSCSAPSCAPSKMQELAHDHCRDRTTHQPCRRPTESHWPCHLCRRIRCAGRGLRRYRAQHGRERPHRLDRQRIGRKGLRRPRRPHAPQCAAARLPQP